MSEMVDAIKQAVEQGMPALEPDEDLPPTLLTHNPEGMSLAQFGITLETVSDRDELADLLTATMVVDRADAAAFVMLAWAVTLSEAPDDEFDFATHPDRREMATIAHITRDGDAFYVAPVQRRKGDHPLLGEWEEYPADGIDGRMHAAMRRGLLLVSNMPEHIDKALESMGPEESADLVMAFLSIERQRAAAQQAATRN
jgi:hypothetical protein